MKFVLIAGALAVAVAAAAALWRFTNFRNSGAQGLFRKLPANGLHGWRHGVLRYSGEELEFFKLRSLAFTRDLALDRRGITITGFRELSEQEQDFMPGISVILELESAAGKFEFASERHAQMALVSWVESAPDRRQEQRGRAYRAYVAQRGRGKA
ncbi:DUF2550 domain-containing protein [Corynebacterium auris]|uniref:DUF2550 domain-containing protein n=1 Tax=Corynebacterium auris TaxID=44750 RepID=UPI0025B5E6A8|nr:DUF2550 domain-containing protein [Corynebacterium auris]WJY67848.1 hypothetical protein CAURIS_04665 [Corynebacterium auris]